MAAKVRHGHYFAQTRRFYDSVTDYRLRERIHAVPYPMPQCAMRASNRSPICATPSRECVGPWVCQCAPHALYSDAVIVAFRVPVHGHANVGSWTPGRAGARRPPRRSRAGRVSRYIRTCSLLKAHDHGAQRARPPTGLCLTVKAVYRRHASVQVGTCICGTGPACRWGACWAPLSSLSTRGCHSGT